MNGPSDLRWIENIDAPVIGESYSVPCVQTDREWNRWGGNPIPVIGPEHEDAEIVKFEAPHWHVDWRFVSPKRFDHLIGLICTPRKQSIGFLPAIVVVAPDAAIFRLDRRMYRQSITFPTTDGDNGKVKFGKPLEDAFATQRLKCEKCPHKGITLTGQPWHMQPNPPPVPGSAKGMPDVQPYRVCPGHGLAWKRDGTLHRRHT